MKTLVLVSIVLSISSACAQTEVPLVNSGFNVQSQCPQDEISRLKPPLEYAGGRPPLQETVVNEIARLLVASNGSPLWCGDTVSDGYRLFWLPAYRPTVVASVLKSNGVWQSTGLEFGDPRQLPPSTTRSTEVVHRLQTLPSEDFLNRLDSAARSANVWTAQSWLDSTERMDGATWILEVRRDKSYRLITRVNVPAASFQELSSLIISSSGMPVPDGIFVSR